MELQGAHPGRAQGLTALLKGPCGGGGSNGGTTVSPVRTTFPWNTVDLNQ